MTDWREKLFGARLVRCESASADGELETVATRDALADCSAERSCDGVELGVYFSFANISAAADDFPLRLEAAWRRVAPRLRVVQVVLWAHGDGAGAAERERGYRESVAGKPWLAVPLHDVRTKRRLTRKYNIAVGVPALVVRGRHVRDALLADPLALHFPWPPPLLSDVLADVPLEPCDAPGEDGGAGGGGKVLYADLPPDTVRLFYFAAHWCPPCRAFAPSLCRMLAAVRARGARHPRAQLILVSSDRSEESYRRSVAAVRGAGALAPAWGAAEARRQLAAALGVAGIPALVPLAADGAPLADAGRAALAADPDGWNFPWAPRAVSVLTERTLLKLERHPALVLFVDDEESELEFAEGVLAPAAAAYRDELRMRRPRSPSPATSTSASSGSSGDEAQLDRAADTSDRARRKGARPWLFLVAVEGTECAERLRARAALDAAAPALAALDAPRGRLAALPTGAALDARSVHAFLDAALAGAAPFRRLRDCGERR